MAFPLSAWTVLLGILVCMMVAIRLDPLFHRYYVGLVKAREAAGGEPGGSEPEYRLPPAIVGAVLVSIGFFGLDGQPIALCTGLWTELKLLLVFVLSEVLEP
ncbi:hypothetical protein V1515DRAFT_420648 [Lipomyces mesembrius]